MADFRAVFFLLLLISHRGDAMRVVIGSNKASKMDANVSNSDFEHVNRTVPKAVQQNESAQATPDAERLLRLYESTNGRGFCPADKILAKGGGYATEQDVQDKCDELDCAVYTWFQEQKTAWFCEVDSHSVKDGRFPKWRVGQPLRSSEGKDVLRYLSKDGRGGCREEYLLLQHAGFTSERSVQRKCEKVKRCIFYIWCNDKKDASYGSAWFCRADSYKSIDNAAEWPKWRVGHPASHSNRVYESKVGRGDCSGINLFHHSAGFTTKGAVQKKCDELQCAFYTWSQDEQNSMGDAWFCKVDSYDHVDNAAKWPKWMVGRPRTSEARVYESKVGRGTCSEVDLLHHSSGFTTEKAVQKECEELRCAFYIWSQDEQDSQGGAWFCKVDSYDHVDNAAEWSNWMVGRPRTSGAEGISNSLKGEASLKVGSLKGEGQRVYESKVGRGTCSEVDLLHHSAGFTTEETVQKKCDELQCAFYTWSQDEQNSVGDAWFYKVDSYDHVDNAAEWPHWMVGRPKQAVVIEP